jgi:hypothetical protein
MPKLLIRIIINKIVFSALFRINLNNRQALKVNKYVFLKIGRGRVYNVCNGFSNLGLFQYILKIAYLTNIGQIKQK